MKMAILTSGIMPIPAVQGGAVETLVDFYLGYNERRRLHDITVFSVWNPDAVKHPALASDVNHYEYIKVEGWPAKIHKGLFHRLHRKDEYYHHCIEFFLYKALKHIRGKHFDVIVLENRPGFALQLTGKTDARIVYHLHNDLLNNQMPHFQHLYDKASYILTVSDYIKKRVQTINPADTKTQTIHNGIDVDSFARSVPAVRKEHGLCDDDFVIVFSGRINKEKGILELVEAMHLLQAEHRIKLLVIGSPFYANTQGDNLFTKTLKAKAEQLGDRIIFTGFIPYCEMPAYLKMADVAVLPSVWEEPLGLTCIEAMACGLPVITTHQGGIPETVTPDCGELLTVDEHLPQRLANVILDFYQSPEKRRQMSAAALTRAQLFDKETYASHFFAAVEAVVRGER